MAAQLKKGILYLDKQRMYLYIQGMTNVLSVDLLPTVARDLEILHKEELAKFVKWIIDTNKLSPARLSIVLSENLLFRKKLTEKGAALEEEKKVFLASVPFEHVGSKVYGQAGSQEILAVNADFVELIKEAFEAHGFVFGDVIPTIFLGTLSMTTHTPDVPTSMSLQRKLESLKAQAILTEHEETGLALTQDFNEEASAKPKAYTPYLPFVLAGLAVVLIVLGIVLYMQFASSSKPTPKARRRIPAVTPAQQTTVLTPQTTRILITSTGAASQTAGAIAQALSGGGYTQLETTTVEGIQSPQTLIVFGPRVLQEQKNTIRGLVESAGTAVVTRENAEVSHDVVITVATQ